jgi:hypothetical protein
MAQRKIDILVEANARTQQAQREINALSNAAKNFVQGIAQGFGQAAYGQIQNAILGIPKAFADAVKEGIRFNQTLETAQLGISAILRQFDGGRLDTFNKAFQVSGVLMDEIRERAQTSAASVETLVESYQTLAGALFAAKVPMQDHIRLTTLLANAITGAGLPQEQIAQEARAILTGTITQDARFAKMLFSDPKLRQSYDQARGRGQLGPWLEQNLKSFDEAAKRSGNTLSVISSNLKDAYSAVMGLLTVDLFEELKGFLQALTEFIKSPAFKQMLKDLLQTLTGIMTAAAYWTNLAANASNQKGAAVTGIGAVASLYNPAIGGAMMAVGNRVSGAEASLNQKKTTADQLKALGIGGDSGLVPENIEDTKARLERWRESWKFAFSQHLVDLSSFLEKRRAIAQEARSKGILDENEFKAELQAIAQDQAAAQLKDMASIFGGLDQLIGGKMFGLSDGLSRRGIFQTRGESRMFSESLNISRRMLEELVGLRRDISKGIFNPMNA